MSTWHETRCYIKRTKGTKVARKTISIELVKQMANGQLADSASEVTEGRIATFVLLERILMATGNYHGYRHIDGHNGEKDDTRRYYY
jgi:hypothetical protein